MKCKIFFCLACSKGSLLKEEIQCGCMPQFIGEGLIIIKNLKITRLQRFNNWILSHDIGFGLAFMGAVFINAILLQHFNLTFKESMFESFCLGFVLIRLFKE